MTNRKGTTSLCAKPSHGALSYGALIMDLEIESESETDNRSEHHLRSEQLVSRRGAGLPDEEEGAGGGEDVDEERSQTVPFPRLKTNNKLRCYKNCNYLAFSGHVLSHRMSQCPWRLST